MIQLFGTQLKMVYNMKVEFVVVHQLIIQFIVVVVDLDHILILHTLLVLLLGTMVMTFLLRNDQLTRILEPAVSADAGTTAAALLNELRQSLLTGAFAQAWQKSISLASKYEETLAATVSSQ